MHLSLRSTSASVLLALAVGSAGAAPAAAIRTGPAPAAPLRNYIVQLPDAPAASYEGGVAGLPATQVASGARLDAQSANVSAYRGHLASRRSAVIARLGANAQVLHQYDLAINGFAVRMTDAQAQALLAGGLVKSVQASRIVRTDTVSTPAFLGLDTPTGAWSQLNGKLRGEDVIIANIDTGVQPESPSFFDHVDGAGRPVASGGTLAYGPPPARWRGTCQTGPGFPQASCNNKLIGARVFSAGFVVNAVPWFGSYYNTPRDEDGHGSHTLATAGGNANAPAATAGGVSLGTASGMAPRARVVAYKALFRQYNQSSLGGSGDEIDILAAIEAAVADGVDVINYSVSGSPLTMVDTIDLSFLNATKAGIFVAASAGNNGNNSVAHPNPWLMTVAASTHDRNPFAKLTLGNGQSFSGPSFTATGLPSAAMVLAKSIPAAGAAVLDASRCKPGSLDPARAAGKLVVCDRGGIITRVEKGGAVAAAGGIGMVLLNTADTDTSLSADVQAVPTVMLGLSDGDQVRAYVAGANASGSIGQRFQMPGVVAPVMANFSSRGPNLADVTVMKPDITAPGVDVYSAFAYQQANLLEHNLIVAGTMAVPARTELLSGTSMSSPHVAGIAALIKQKFPLWSPDLIKSAMMTSASSVKLGDGSAATDRSYYGAGHINANGALDPGLVFPISARDYTGFLCAGQWLEAGSSECSRAPVMASQDLNLPSMAGEIIGQTTYTRTVRNVTNAPMTVSASASMPGFVVTVDPPVMTVTPGRNAKFKVNVARDTAPFGELASGSMAWSDGSRTVSSPIQVRAISLKAPGELLSSATSGSASYPVTYGFMGNTSTQVYGMKAATRYPLSAPSFEQTCVPLPVVNGNIAFRAAVYYADSDIADFVGLQLVNNDTFQTIFGQYDGVSEIITVPSLPPGNYRVCLFPFNNGFTLHTTMNIWTFDASDQAGSLTVTGLPNGPIALGQSFNAQARWAGLTAGLRYVGLVSYGAPDGSLAGVTVVRIEPGLTAAVNADARGAPTPVMTRGSAYSILRANSNSNAKATQKR